MLFGLGTITGRWQADSCFLAFRARERRAGLVTGFPGGGLSGLLSGLVSLGRLIALLAFLFALLLGIAFLAAALPGLLALLPLLALLRCRGGSRGRGCGSRRRGLARGGGG